MLTPTSASCCVVNSSRLAELGHVREHRHVDGGADGGELLEAGHRLREDRVRSGVDERLRAVDGRLETFDAPDVGARHDQEVRVAAGLDGRADALERGVLVDDLLAVEVPAALRVHLVLEVQAGEAGVLEHLHGAGDVHRLAESGVGVDQGGQVGDARDLAGALGDLRERREADIRQPEVGAEHRARDVDALEPLVLDEQGAERVEGARHPHELAAREAGAERRALRGCGQRRVQHQNSPFGGTGRPGAMTLSPPSSSALSSGRRCASARNRSISAALENALGQHPELPDVVGARERPRAERVRVGDRDLVDDAAAVGQLDLDATAERLLGRVERVVAPGPLRVLDRRDLVPELDGVGAPARAPGA